MEFMKSELMNMDFIEVCIHTTNEAIEPITNVLTDIGTNGVVIEDSYDLIKKRETPLGEVFELNPNDFPADGVYIKTYIPKTMSYPKTIETIKDNVTNLKNFNIDIGNNEVTHEVVQEEDWSTSWQKYYKPVQVSDRITIKPTWEEYIPKQTKELIIELDPGMAFGTGTHATTKLSLQQLEKYIKNQDRVMDVGCGSGILSIASIKLGAAHVDAYDLDEVAVTSAKQNAQLNNVESHLTIRKNNLLENINKQVDIIVSNILAEVIVQFVDDAWVNLKVGGMFLTSGIIEKKKDIVLEKLRSTGFEIIDVKEIDGWIAIAAQK